MASAKFLEEALSTDVDESAVSAIVGSLENQLVTSTPTTTRTTGNTTILNQNHVNSAISNGGTIPSQKHGTIANGETIVNTADSKHVINNTIITSSAAQVAAGAIQNPSTINYTSLTTNDATKANEAVNIVYTQAMTTAGNIITNRVTFPTQNGTIGINPSTVLQTTAAANVQNLQSKKQTLVIQTSGAPGSHPSLVTVPMNMTATVPQVNNVGTSVSQAPNILSNLQVVNVRPGIPTQAQKGQPARVVLSAPQLVGARPGTPQLTLQSLQGLQPGQGGHLLLKTENGQYQLLRVGPAPGAGGGATGTAQPVTFRMQTVPAPVTTTPVSNASTGAVQQPTPPPPTIVTTPVQKPANDNTKEKCRKFLANLLELSSREPKTVERNVRSLIQDLIDMRVEPEDFCDRLERLLNASPQPCLIGFLKKSLPLLRHSLATKEMTIEGIRPPPINVAFSIAGASGTTTSTASPAAGTQVPATPTPATPSAAAQAAAVAAAQQVQQMRTMGGVPQQVRLVTPGGGVTTTTVVRPAAIVQQRLGSGPVAATAAVRAGQIQQQPRIVATAGGVASAQVLTRPPLGAGVTAVTPGPSIGATPSIGAQPQIVTTAAGVVANAPAVAVIGNQPPALHPTVAFPTAIGAQQMRPAIVRQPIQVRQAVPPGAQATPSLTAGIHQVGATSIGQSIVGQTIQRPMGPIPTNFQSSGLQGGGVTHIAGAAALASGGISAATIAAQAAAIAAGTSSVKSPAILKAVGGIKGGKAGQVVGMGGISIAKSKAAEKAAEKRAAAAAAASSGSSAVAAAVLAASAAGGSGFIGGDDDINDVAAMGGVNLAEETQKILGSTEMIGTQIRSCKEDLFLSASALQTRIRSAVQRHGLDPGEQSTTWPDVAAMISHAAQERVRCLIEKLAIITEHRLEIIKSDARYEVTTDIKGQLKFLEDVDRAERKRHEEFERELLLRAAKSRSKTEDPEQAKLKARAKELQRVEMEELRQREANATALQAIGPRKKPKLSTDGSNGSSGGGELGPAGSSSSGTNNGANGTEGSGGIGGTLNDSMLSASGRSTIGSGGVNSSTMMNGPAGLGRSSPSLSSRSTGQVTLRQRTKKVTLRDLQFLFETEKDLCKSTALYKSYLK